jgi:hypothetical protein
MKKMIDDRSSAHMNFYIVQFINYLHQFHRAIEAIVPLFVREFLKFILFLPFFDLLALSC